MTQISRGEEQFNTTRAVHLAVVAALGGFLFGYDTAVINGAVTALREDFGMGAAITGLVVASALLALRSARGRQGRWPTVAGGSR